MRIGWGCLSESFLPPYVLSSSQDRVRAVRTVKSGNSQCQLHYMHRWNVFQIRCLEDIGSRPYSRRVLHRSFGLSHSRSWEAEISDLQHPTQSLQVYEQPIRLPRGLRHPGQGYCLPSMRQAAEQVNKPRTRATVIL